MSLAHRILPIFAFLVLLLALPGAADAADSSVLRVDGEPAVAQSTAVDGAGSELGVRGVDDRPVTGSIRLRHTAAREDSVGTRGGVAANTARSFGQFGAAEIRAAASAADRGGLTRVGRALQKHSDRRGSVFGSLSSGNPIARNEQGMRVLDEILGDPGATTQVLDNVTNIWDSTDRGVRINNDGTFMGFLEPLR